MGGHEAISLCKGAIRTTLTKNRSPKKASDPIDWIKQLMEICLTMENKLNISSSVVGATMAKNLDFFETNFEESNLK